MFILQTLCYFWLAGQFLWHSGEKRRKWKKWEEMGLRFWVLGENGFWISARMGFVGGLGLGGRVSREQPSSPVGTHRAEKEHVRTHRVVKEHVKTHWGTTSQDTWSCLVTKGQEDTQGQVWLMVIGGRGKIVRISETWNEKIISHELKPRYRCPIFRCLFDPCPW